MGAEAQYNIRVKENSINKKNLARQATLKKMIRDWPKIFIWLNC